MQYTIIPEIVSRVANKMNLHKPQTAFLTELVMSWMCVQGRFNFTNMGRFCRYNERTLRRWFGRCFPWASFHHSILSSLFTSGAELILAMDATFVPKSGKKTDGLGWFWRGTANRAEKGLEASVISIVNMAQNTAYALSVCQTRPKPKKKGKRKTKSGAALTSIDQAIKQIQQVPQKVLQRVACLAVDGNYSTKKFVDAVVALDIVVVGHLRSDADMKYLYQGRQKGRGRRRKYDGKVDWKRLKGVYWTEEGAISKHIRVRTATLYHCSLKRTVKVAMIYRKSDPSDYALLFSTETGFGGQDVVRYYRARFQIEFLFRDAKQHMGFTDCQARSSQKIEYHWNAAMASLNLAKLTLIQDQPTRLSMASHKRRYNNWNMLKLFSQKLEIEWSSIKNHPAFTELCNYGMIAY